MTCSLEDLPKGTLARVTDLKGEKHDIQHLMGMGIRNHTLVKMIRKLFFGRNYVVAIGDEYLVLRRHESQCLKVTTSF